LCVWQGGRAECRKSAVEEVMLAALLRGRGAAVPSFVPCDLGAVCCMLSSRTT
jgi:hypothetical protein